MIKRADDKSRHWWGKGLINGANMEDLKSILKRFQLEIVLPTDCNKY